MTLGREGTSYANHMPGIAKEKIEIASENPDVPLLKRVEAGYIHTKHYHTHAHYDFWH